ncbi:MAG: phosphatidate cytidylyltransferase [Zoogloea sp.]|nr:phosphatidate cytidylyltransferase [Zoogloea sp.]
MLKVRVLTALALLAGLLAALFLLPAAGWLVFAALIGTAAAWEWGGLVGFSTTLRAVYSALIGGACLACGLAAGLDQAHGAMASQGLIALFGASVLFWLACVPFWLARRWHLGNPAAAALVGLLVLLPPSLAIAQLRLFGPWVLLGVLAAVWVADISAYFTGRAFGRRKLAPNISPGKSWEGAFGAGVGVVIYGLIVVAALSGPGYLDLPHLGGWTLALVILTCVSIIGDLFESLLKRQAGVKDSGKLLPGHGGILDRIDSLTSTLPLAGLAASWLAC